MTFDEIILHNFGVYLGRQAVSLKPTLRKPIILFGGLNGVGKTTLLDAFQLSMFGKFANCSNRDNLAYDKFLAKCVHKAVDLKDGSAVSVRFRHSTNGVEHTFQINRSWRINRKNLSETVEVLRDGEYDPVLTETWHEHAEQFMPLRISSLFFFDGEKIKDLANFGKSTDLIATGINQLLGLDLIDQLMTDLVVLEKRKKVNLTDKFKRKQIEQIEGKIRNLSKRKNDLLWQLQDSEKVKKLLDAQIKVIDEKFRLEGGDLYKNREALESEREKAIKEKEEIEDTLMELAGSELPFTLVKEDLRQIIELSEIEEKATDNEKLYDTIKQRDKAILDELKKKAISPEIVNEVQSLFEHDLKERSVFKEVKRYLDLDKDTRASIKFICEESLQSLVSKTKAFISERNSKTVQIENLDRKLASVPETEVIAKIVKEKEMLKKSRRECEINHEVLSREFQEIEKSIAAAERELDKELTRELESEYEQNTAVRIIKHSEKARGTLETFKDKVIAHHLKRIQGFVLDAFKQLLRKETLVAGLTIDPKTYETKLFGKDNGHLDVRRLSAGERQLLAVSLLWGLAQASGRPLPTIIDTPLGRLDATHRMHLVKRYFPHASHQVLLLSTDEEISDKYYRMIKPWVAKEYHLEFNESEESTTIKRGYFW